jgi:hypothetical protein
MEYQKGKNKQEDVPELLTKQLFNKNKKTRGPAHHTNLYDYDMARDRAKEQDTPSTEEYMDTYHYQGPTLLETDNLYDTEYKTRGLDPTEEPQYPDISLDSKRAHHRVIARYMRSFLNKTAATLNEIIKKDTHRSHSQKATESLGCTVVDVSKPSDKEKGKYTFRVKAADSANTRTTIFQFLKNTNKDAKTLLDYPVMMGCSCPSFLWWGAQFYALSGKYMFLPMFRPSNRAPKPEDAASSVSPNGKINYGRGLGFTVCKHILASASTLKDVKIKTDESKKYRPSGPRQRIFNPTQWEKSYGVFGFSDILKLEKSGRIPNALTQRVKQLENFEEVENFLTDEINGWKSWDDSKKINYIRNLVGHPDLTLYIMLRDYQINGKQSSLLRENLYDSIDTVLQFNDSDGKIVHDSPKYLEKYSEGKSELEDLISSGGSKIKEVVEEPKKVVSDLITKMFNEEKRPSDAEISPLFGKNLSKARKVLKDLKDKSNKNDQEAPAKKTLTSEPALNQDVKDLKDKSNKQPSPKDKIEDKKYKSQYTWEELGKLSSEEKKDLVAYLDKKADRLQSFGQLKYAKKIDELTNLVELMV